MSVEQWQDPHAKCLGMLMDGRAQPTGVRKQGADATLLLIVNSHYDGVNFTLPQVPEGEHWVCLMDTNHDGDPPDVHFEPGSHYTVTGRSLLLFELEKN